MITIKKISLSIFTAVFCSLIYFSVPFQVQASVPVSTTFTDSTEITPRAHDIRWRYKEINGQIYRCLYDYTIDDWVGNWELC